MSVTVGILGAQIKSYQDSFFCLFVFLSILSAHGAPKMAIHAYVYICTHFYVFCKVSQHPSASVLRDVDGVEEVKDRGRGL